jgi:uncharacterized protein (UPF0335 family)
MTDFPNKIVTIILVFIMLVLAPLTWSYVRGEMRSEILVLNEVTQFIDKVTDKASITNQDIDDLYMGVNSTGGTYDVRVKRYVRLATKDADGSLRTLYLSDDYKDNLKMNIGDVVKVSIEEIGVSPAKRLMWSILRIDEGKTKFSLAGTVR